MRKLRPRLLLMLLLLRQQQQQQLLLDRWSGWRRVGSRWSRINDALVPLTPSLPSRAALQGSGFARRRGGVGVVVIVIVIVSTRTSTSTSGTLATSSTLAASAIPRGSCHRFCL